MTGSTISRLPRLNPPASGAGGRNWAKQSPPAKISLPVVEVKKAMKLLKGAGKSLAAIELMPGGGFRVVAAVQSKNKGLP
ncbi:hypothetical protein [Paracoccus sp. IB05]|uniref:hypothetical protein n=1 Tax=Paracoccus sp. IB05 TaxID=2779367 RepID=UPI0018E8A43D|nr:hypothetical protein [Paracoccus sp. IB05]MBJ2151568.1 hypothetical protein [Paracoccus sp. IB05]